VAESVGCARKDKNVGRSVSGRQVLAFQVAREKRFGQQFRKFLRVRSVADDTKLDRQPFGAEPAIRFSQKIEILFLRNAADIQQSDLSVFRTELFEERRIAAGRMEKLGVESTRKDFQFFRLKPALDPALTVFLRVHEDGVELIIKPVHVAPRHALEK